MSVDIVWCSTSGGADSKASTSANWIGGIAPGSNGHVAVFNAGTMPCIWDITNTIFSMLINSSYNAQITQTANLVLSGYFIFDSTG